MTEGEKKNVFNLLNHTFFLLSEEDLTILKKPALIFHFLFGTMKPRLL